MATKQTLDALNAGTLGDFIVALGDIFENAPWVAEEVAAARPFVTVTSLHDTMLAAVHAASPGHILSFLRGHPELAGAAAIAGTIGDASMAEQTSLGLHSATNDTAVFGALNTTYMERFGFPFILCLRRHTCPSVLSEFQRRLGLDPVSERATALQEIGFITRLRIAERVIGPGMPTVNGSLTTHILDTAKGQPAPGVVVELRSIDGARTTRLATATTGWEGRTEHPLLSGAPLRIGVYELCFHIGDYLGDALAEQPPFLDVIPVRFGISEPERHYHIPLLVSPGAYSTYRGY